MIREKLIILGAGEPLSQEIARLGRALGHEIVGISAEGKPDLDEPWVQGVEWIKADPARVDLWKEQLRGGYGVVAVSAAFSSEASPFIQTAVAAARAAEELAVSRFVYLHRREASGAKDIAHAESGADEAILAMNFDAVVFNFDGSKVLPLEQIAMAALRAVLEDEIQGILDMDAIAHLGDALMIQG